MWRRYYSILLVLLLTANEKAKATDWERLLSRSKLNTSSFAFAGNVLLCDTLQLARQYNSTDVAGHFVNARVTDSLFNAYVYQSRKEDSSKRSKQMIAFNVMVAKENERVRRLKLPPVGFEEPSEEQRIYVYDMLAVKRYRLKINEVLKPGDDVKKDDTLTVIVLPARKWDTTTNITKGRVVVYNKLYDNKEEVINKDYFTPEMYDFYRREKIYFITPDRIEPEQWKAILVQY